MMNGAFAAMPGKLAADLHDLEPHRGVIDDDRKSLTGRQGAAAGRQPSGHDGGDRILLGASRRRSAAQEGRGPCASLRGFRS